ncbi:phage major capsid protein [Rothia koreensis]|uniref:phage major capsid protein n=1 Tax=Rothia koreensis TaxID=592378 RepID=UPI003F266B3E
MTGTEWATIDPFAEAIAASEDVGGTLRTFVANPADALALATAKKQDGSNEPLLGIDATAPGARQIMGVNVLVSPKVKPGTIWGIDPAFSHVVIRDDVAISVSEDVAFNTDQVAVKARMRVGFGFGHPASLVKISLAKSAG